MSNKKGGHLAALAVSHVTGQCLACTPPSEDEGAVRPLAAGRATRAWQQRRGRRDGGTEVTVTEFGHGQNVERLRRVTHAIAVDKGYRGEN
jgi:hypothetical protein